MKSVDELVWRRFDEKLVPESSHERLVLAMQNYRPGRILQMGDLNHVKAGISSYEKCEVQWVGWQGKETVVFQVAKTKLKIALDRKENVVCTCGFCGPNNCWHSVATMATVAHALRGKMGLSSYKFPEDTFVNLREALFDGPEPEDEKAAKRKTLRQAANKSGLPPLRIA